MENYRFQNFLNICIETNNISRFKEYFYNEYARIDKTCEKNGAPNAKISLEIVKELPAPKNGTISRSERFKGLFRYNFSIDDLDSDHIKIFFQYHPIASIYTTAMGVFIQAQVLEPIMYLALLRQNILLMHSAGVTKSGVSYIFPAHGGTGKTTTCINLLDKGFSLLGDDLVLIDPKNARAFPYPRPLHVFTYNINTLQGAKIPWSLKFFVHMKNILRFFLEKILRTDFLISTRIHADQLFTDLRASDSASLHIVLFLKKQGDHESVTLTEVNIKEHAQQIIESADLNVSLYRLLDQRQMWLVKENEIEVATSILKKVNSFGYLNTRKANADEIEQRLVQSAPPC